MHTARFCGPGGGVMVPDEYGPRRGGGYCPRVVCHFPCLWTDKYVLKYYLPTTSFAGGKNKITAM